MKGEATLLMIWVPGRGGPFTIHAIPALFVAASQAASIEHESGISNLICFPWILWFIYKNRNGKIYKNQRRDPFELLRTAEIESVTWAESQTKDFPNVGSSYNVDNLITGDISRCYIDGAWRAQDSCTEQGWVYNAGESTDTMMGAMSIRKSLSPLHAECEELIWAMECMKTLRISEVVFATDCSQLVKMVSTPKERPTFTTHIEEFLRCKEFFYPFTIQHIPRAQNTMADKLARGARNQPAAMVYVDSIPTRWFLDMNFFRSL